MSSQATEPNSCEICGQKFNTQDDLVAHKRDTHVTKTPPSPPPK